MIELEALGKSWLQAWVGSLKHQELRHEKNNEIRPNLYVSAKESWSGLTCVWLMPSCWTTRPRIGCYVVVLSGRWTWHCSACADPFWLRPCQGTLDRSSGPGGQCMRHWPGLSTMIPWHPMAKYSPPWTTYASCNNFCWSFHVTFASQGGILHHAATGYTFDSPCPTNLGRSPWMPHNRRRNCWQNGGWDTTSAGWEGALRRNEIFLHAILTWHTSWLPKTIS